MIKMSVRVDNINGLDAQFGEVVAAIEANLETVAANVAANAKSSAAFADKDGNLRKSISYKKSKFENGGFIVAARAPHAHLVEFGHVMLNKFGAPTKLRRVPAHPFLRKAVEQGIKEAVRLFMVEK
jgi:HK97 gp10 family phage protein